jgi:hypothetical protein
MNGSRFHFLKTGNRVYKSLHYHLNFFFQNGNEITTQTKQNSEIL